GRRTAARELVVERRPGTAEREVELKVVPQERAARHLDAVALALAAEVPGPPLRDPDLSAAREAVGRDLAEEDRAVASAAVGLGREAEVVRREAGADPPEAAVHRDVAAVLVEGEPSVPARERRGVRVDADVGRVRPLVVALLGALEAEDGGAAAGHRASRDPARHHPVVTRVEKEVS